MHTLHVGGCLSPQVDCVEMRYWLLTCALLISRFKAVIIQTCPHVSQPPVTVSTFYPSLACHRCVTSCPPHLSFQLFTRSQFTQTQIISTINFQMKDLLGPFKDRIINPVMWEVVSMSAKAHKTGWWGEEGDGVALFKLCSGETLRRAREALMDFINFISASFAEWRWWDELRFIPPRRPPPPDKSSRDPHCEPWEWLSDCLTGESTMRSRQNMRGVSAASSQAGRRSCLWNRCAMFF